jgi:hypothetical protein
LYESISLNRVRTDKKAAIIYSGIALVLILLSSTFSSTVVAAKPAAGTVTFNAAINLSNDKGKATQPAVSNNRQNVFVAWTEGSGGIKFRASSNGGVIWTPPTSSAATTISSGSGCTGSAAFPVMFTQFQSSTDVAVAWSQGGQICAAVSTNNGGTFAKAHLSVSPSSGGITPAIGASGSDIYVTWYQATPSCPVTIYVPAGSGCIWVSTSTNNGASWSKPSELNPSSRGEPQVVASGANVYITADGIYFEASNNSGTTWTAPLNLYNQSSLTAPCAPLCYGREPWVAANGTNVYVVWESSNTNQTTGSTTDYRDYGRMSGDGGKTWTPPLSNPYPQLMTGAIKNDWEPENAAFGSHAFLTFHNLSNQGIYMTSTTNSGSSWSTPALVSPTGKGSSFGHVFSSDGTNVFVMWGQVKSGSVWNAYVSYSANNGTSWSNPIDISNNAAGVAAGNLDVTLFGLSSNGANCFAAWTYTNGGTSQVYFASS